MQNITNASNKGTDNAMLFTEIFINWMKEFLSIPQNVIILFVIILLLIFNRNKISKYYQVIIDFCRPKLNIPVLKNLIWAVISCLSSPIFSAIITIILPFAIEKYFSNVTQIVIIWSLLVILNSICCNYSKGRNKARKWFLSSLKQYIPLYNKTEALMYNSRKELKETLIDIAKSGKFKKKMLKEQFNFNNAAQYVCDSIYGIIKDVTGSENHQITVFRKFQDDDAKECPVDCPIIKECANQPRTSWAKMVACANKSGVESKSSEQEHCTKYYSTEKTKKNAKNQKQHFYIQFFENNSNKVEIISGKMNIKENFLFHTLTESREENIEEYIGIPVYCLDPNKKKSSGKHTTYAVIQIDFQKKGLLGKTETSITEFIDNVFGGMIAYLNCCLQVDSMIDRLFEHVEEIHNIKNSFEKDTKKEIYELTQEKEELLKKIKKLESAYNDIKKTSKTRHW